MIVRFKKLECGGADLTCVRSDQSTTWLRPKSNHAAFFVLHDLTHFAVESELKEWPGFFSLLASGWEIADFQNSRSGEKVIPWSAAQIELLVGQLDMERASHADWSAEQLNDYVETHNQSQLGRSLALPKNSLSINDEQLNRIKSRRTELFAAWRAVAVGETLELEFDHLADSLADSLVHAIEYQKESI